MEWGDIIVLGLAFFGFILVVSVISALIWRATGDAILGLLVGFLPNSNGTFYNKIS